MRTWFKITAYNTQAQYGYGTEAQANEYVEYHNKDREINVYAYRAVTDADEIARLERGDEGFAFDDVDYDER